MSDITNERLSELIEFEEQSARVSHGRNKERYSDVAKALRELQYRRIKVSGVTHHADCWGSGPEHYQCALNEIETLQRQLAALRRG